MTSISEKDLAELAKFPDMNPGPVCRLDGSGKVMLANAAARRLFGEENLQGRTWQDICPGVSEEVWRAAKSSTTPVQHEADFGGHCVLFTHVRSSSSDTVFAFGSDVTSLRKAERELAEVARFPEMNPGPVLRVDLTGKILLANKAARETMGEKVVGCLWKEICPGVSPSLWQQILDSEESVLLEAQIKECIFIFAHKCDPTTKLVFVFGTDITKQKLAEKTLRQTEKMATLGTLAAGVAHELNNPAAATKRAADHMRDAFESLERALLQLDTSKLDDEGRKLMGEISATARVAASRPNDLDPISRSDLESQTEEWLEERGAEDAWDIAPTLVAQGLHGGVLDRVGSALAPDLVLPVITWAAKAFPVYRLLHEISQGSGRISEIVAAMKGYSYVGQAPLRMIDLHEGLDNTLVILRSKLKQGITVKREYDPSIPKVCAFGSELNQVWTNILDNAADAVSGKGEITIRTMNQDGWARVDITDNGPGMPEEVQARIFDPFFTTKAPGKGTGLGLSTTYSIIKDKHKGDISITSVPGKTTFTVKLLIDNPELAHDQKDERAPAPKE